MTSQEIGRGPNSSNVTLANGNEIDHSIVDAVKPISLPTSLNPSTTDQQQDVTTFQLFRYATTKDLCMMLLGSIAAIAHGSSMPLMTIIFSDVIQAFTNFTTSTTLYGYSETAKNDLEDVVIDKVKLFLILGSAVFVLAYLQMAMWMISGENQAKVYVRSTVI